MHMTIPILSKVLQFHLSLEHENIKVKYLIEHGVSGLALTNPIFSMILSEMHHIAHSIFMDNEGHV